MDYSWAKFPKEYIKKHKRLTVSEETYQKVFETCKGQCVLCGVTKNLELHHINGRGKDLTDNPKNCVMLCKECHHNRVHQNLKKYRPILIGIAKEFYGSEKE